jgi:hypothetical protein
MTFCSPRETAYLPLAAFLHLPAAVLLPSIAGCLLGHLQGLNQFSVVATAYASCEASDRSSRMHHLDSLIQPGMPLARSSLQFGLCCNSVL